MNTKQEQVEREVTPQFGGAGNLGTFKLNYRGFEGRLEELTATPEREAYLAHMLNGQANISYPGPEIAGHVRKVLQEKYGKPESKGSLEWHQKHLEEAKKIAEILMKDYTIDFVDAFVSAANRHAKRGQGEAKRTPLADFIRVETFIVGKWSTAKEETKKKLVEQLKLEGETQEEVLASLRKKYCAPVVLDLDALDEE